MEQLRLCTKWKTAHEHGQVVTIPVYKTVDVDQIVERLRENAVGQDSVIHLDIAHQVRLV